MRRVSPLRIPPVAAACAASLALACSSGPDPAPEPTFPRAKAPPSRHAALNDALVRELPGLSFAAGDWLEDYGDAPWYGIVATERLGDAARRDAALQRARALVTEDLLKGDIQEITMSGLGLIEHLAATGDRSDLGRIDDFVDRLDRLAVGFGWYLDLGGDLSWALKTYGPTSISALIGLVNAQYVLLVGGARAQERLDFAREMDEHIRERALGPLQDWDNARTVTAFKFGKEKSGLFLYPNVAMIALEARLFRLTRDARYLDGAKATYDAIQPLRLSAAPARYYSPYSAAEMGAKTRDYSTLSSHNYLALSLLLLFEGTGEARFADEADRVLDAIERMRGRWCLSNVHDAAACAGGCGAGRACVDKRCADDRCQDGVLHHVMDGRLAAPQDPSFFCAGCNLQSLYVLGYRRQLAGEAW
jgi:hypothetical protein